MASISCQHIYKIYPGATAPSVTDFNLEIQDKEFIIIAALWLRQKSTTLRMIAGLEEISKGESVHRRPSDQRRPRRTVISPWCSRATLWRPMTRLQEHRFRPGAAQDPEGRDRQRVHEAAKILEIEHLLDRKPNALSGGQRQRVALGRAMVRNPAVFLLDEPLSKPGCCCVPACAPRSSSCKQAGHHLQPTLPMTRPRL